MVISSVHRSSVKFPFTQVWMLDSCTHFLYCVHWFFYMAYSTLTEPYFYKCLCIDTPVSLHVLLLAFVDEIIYLCGIPRDLGMSTNQTAAAVSILTSQVTPRLLTRRNELSEEQGRPPCFHFLPYLADFRQHYMLLSPRRKKRTIDSDLMSHFGAECVFYVP